MEEIWNAVEDLRRQHESLRAADLPVDVFSLIELDLRLDVIPFDDVAAKYQVEAALKADCTGIYVDAETYLLLDAGPLWKLKRLRFSLAHEVGHFVLHRKLAQAKHFASLPDFARWMKDYDGRIYAVEQEANEFAGRLLVPPDRLQGYYDEFTSKLKQLMPQGAWVQGMRDQFCEAAGQKFGVNAQVIGARLDREGLWASG
jgi:hypothetical protein